MTINDNDDGKAKITVTTLYILFAPPKRRFWTKTASFSIHSMLSLLSLLFLLSPFFSYCPPISTQSLPLLFFADIVFFCSLSVPYHHFLLYLYFRLFPLSCRYSAELKNTVKWTFLIDLNFASQEIAVHGTWRRALARPAMTGTELAREKSNCLPAATSYSGERGNPPDTYRGDQREARLVRNLYHIFLLYTTIVPSLSSSFQNRFRSVRGRAQWARHAVRVRLRARG